MPKKYLTLLSCFVLAAGPAHARTQQQVKAISDEYASAKAVLLTDDRCALLDSSTRLMAESVLVSNGPQLDQIGYNTASLRQQVETYVKDKTCHALAADNWIVNGKNHFEAVAGTVLAAWETHFLANPPDEDTKCVGYPMGDTAYEGIKRQKYLIDRMRENPMAARLSSAVAAYRMQIGQICASNNHQAREHPLFKMGHHAWNITIKTRDAERYGLQIYRPNSLYEVLAFRWTSPQPEYRVDIPWAVIQDVREKLPEKEGTLGKYFMHKSSLKFGFLRDGTFLATLSPPVFADFTSDIFDSLILTDATDDRQWTLSRRTQAFDVSRPPDESKDQYVKPHATFRMSTEDSTAVRAAFTAGHDLSLQVVRKMNGQKRILETDDINVKDFPTALAYSLAPEMKVK